MTPQTVRVDDAILSGADWVTGNAVFGGTAVMYTSKEFPKGYRHSTRDEVKGFYLPTARPVVPLDTNAVEVAPKPPARTCFVDGQEVQELAVLIKPVAFFVTTSNGTYELSRCYYQNGRFTFGPDMERIGGIGCRSAEYNRSLGLLLHFEHGYEMFIPSSHCQATWKLPDAV